MFKRAFCVMTVLMILSACSSDDSHEGQSCTTNDDCGGNLTCQPIQGRQSAYCCPAPATASSNGNCHPAA